MGTTTAVRFNTGPQGTPVSIANAGLLSTPQLNGGSAVFDTAAAGEGTFGVTITSVAGLVAIIDVPMQGQSLATEWTSTEVTFHTPTVTPNVDSTLIQWRDTTTNIVLMRLLYSATSGALYLQGGTGSSAVTLLAGVVPLNTQYDVALAMLPSTTSAAPFDGRFMATLYLHSSRAVQGTASNGSATVAGTYNTGITAPSGWRLGVSTVLTASTVHKYDTPRAETARSTVLGVYTPPTNNPPTLGVITDQTIALGATTTITAVATDTDGTVASTGGYSWSVTSYPGTTPPTLTNQSNATVTVNTTPLTSAGDVVLSVTATDNGGAVSNARTATVHVTATAGASVDPNRVVSNPGGWGYGGTATDLVDGMSNTGEWILTSAGPSGAIIIAGFPAVPTNDAVIDFYVDLVKSDGTTLADVGQTGTLQAQFFAGTTAISDVVNQSVTRTEAHVVITLTAAQNTAFTNAGRTDPRIQLTASAT